MSQVVMEWTQLRPIAEADDTAQLLSLIDAVGKRRERISLCQALIRHFAFDEWENKNLDIMIAVAEYAIEECDGPSFMETANLIAYNTSANLCDCWGDDFQRSSRHFEKGIEYARKALWLRQCLDKGPGREAMAVWALGKHQLSLGRIEDATESFRKCLQLETLAAEQAGRPAKICLGAPDGYLIAVGYVALMERDKDTLGALAEVLDAMAAQNGEAEADAEIIASQLRETAKKIDPTLWPS